MIIKAISSSDRAVLPTTTTYDALFLSVNTSTVAEGNTSITGLADKYNLKWLMISTTSTDWYMKIYTKDDYATGETKIVNGRNGNYFIYLDMPWEDVDGTGEFHYNFSSSSGSETHNIGIKAIQLK